MLTIPDLEPAIAYLGGLDDPTIEMRLVRLVDPNYDAGELRQRIGDQPSTREALAKQHSDGSWGSHERAGNRLLPTLWMVKALGELGLDRSHPGWNGGVRFITDIAATDGGVFSISGKRDGVLSCYVGIAALVYLHGGYPDLARAQLEWILRHQDLRVGGEEVRSVPAEQWGSYLATKYGGCMGETTCLVGLLRTGRALAAWGHSDADDMVEGIRQVFLSRRLFRTSGGSVVPLAVSPSKAADWLVPTYPLDWRVDLIELVEFVARTGSPDERIQDAIDVIADFRLADGTWPLLRSYRPDELVGFSRPSKNRANPMATMRAVEALWPLAVGAG